MTSQCGGRPTRRGRSPVGLSGLPSTAASGAVAERYRVHADEHGTERFKHPLAGPLTIAREAFTLPDDSSQTLFIYTPPTTSRSRPSGSLLGTDPAQRSHIRQQVENGVGRTRLQCRVIQQFQKEYELRLYGHYYAEHCWINHKPPPLGNPYTSYAIVGVPPTSRRRILELHRSLGHVAKVSIDTKFSAADPDHAEVVKILLDWGVELYWLRGYVSNKPEQVHTDSDLRQPYRGPRFRACLRGSD
jgi:hypothetical protein